MTMDMVLVPQPRWRRGSLRSRWLLAGCLARPTRQCSVLFPNIMHPFRSLYAPPGRVYVPLPHVVSPFRSPAPDLSICSLMSWFRYVMFWSAVRWSGLGSQSDIFVNYHYPRASD